MFSPLSVCLFFCVLSVSFSVRLLRVMNGFIMNFWRSGPCHKERSINKILVAITFDHVPDPGFQELLLKAFLFTINVQNCSLYTC